MGGPAGAGEGGSPLLDLGGYTGRLDGLLALARAQQIDLAAIGLPDMVEQLTARLQDGRASLGQQGDWVVMAAWLVLLRSRLLFPGDAEVPESAGGDTGPRRPETDEMQAAARWLEGRLQLGQDVFARGRPGLAGVQTPAGYPMDVIAFLWASLALFDDDLPGPDMTAQLRLVGLDLHAIADARARIMRRLADAQTCRLDQLLPNPPGPGAPPDSALRRRSRWTSAFAASLHLAQQGQVMLDQGEAFSSIDVSISSACLRLPDEEEDEAQAENRCR